MKWNIGMTLDDAEKEIINECLRFFGNNKSQTARALGISLRGLDGKIERFNLKGKNEDTSTISNEQKDRTRGRRKDLKSIDGENISKAS